MKALPFLLIAAVSALCLLPISFGLAVSLFLGASLASVSLADYTRSARRPRLHTAPTLTRVPASTFRLAA
jgi:hypothetical protein